MLCGAIASPIGAVRSAIVTAVGAIVRGSGDRGDRFSDWGGAVDLLLKGLDDVEAMVRLEAVNAIAGIGLGSAVLRVVELLGDEHEEVRRSAAIALGKLDVAARHDVDVGERNRSQRTAAQSLLLLKHEHPPSRTGRLYLLCYCFDHTPL